MKVRHKMNARRVLEEFRKEYGEIEAISLRVPRGAPWLDSDQAEVLFFDKNEVEKGLRRLDFEFDNGYGAEQGYTLYAWFKDWIIVKGVYDGSEWYQAIPRNPNKEVVPESIGGG